MVQTLLESRTGCDTKNTSFAIRGEKVLCRVIRHEFYLFLSHIVSFEKVSLWSVGTSKQSKKLKKQTELKRSHSICRIPLDDYGRFFSETGRIQHLSDIRSVVSRNCRPWGTYRPRRSIIQGCYHHQQ